MPSLRFFNLDLHISVIQDVKSNLYELFGDEIEIVNWSVSGHNWVFKQDTPTVDVVNQKSWVYMNHAMIQEFQARYDDILSTFDGFIVTHTPVFALLYEKYGKPVVMVNSCRYEQPFSWTNDMGMWEHLNAALKRMYDARQLIAISNNRADVEYLKAGTGIQSEYIPSLCSYTKARYTPTREDIVVYGNLNLFPPSTKLVERPSSGYSWEDLYAYKAIVHVPYEMSTMSTFEQITAGVPLFFPTKRFYVECIQNGSMQLISQYATQQILAQVYDFYKSIDLWIDNADYYVDDGTPYTMKYLYYYDSFDDLVGQVESFNETDEIRQKRQEWLIARRERVLADWKRIMISAYPQLSLD